MWFKSVVILAAELRREHLIRVRPLGQPKKEKVGNWALGFSTGPVPLSALGMQVQQCYHLGKIIKR